MRRRGSCLCGALTYQIEGEFDGEFDGVWMCHTSTPAALGAGESFP